MKCDNPATKETYLGRGECSDKDGVLILIIHLSNVVLYRHKVHKDHLQELVSKVEIHNW